MLTKRFWHSVVAALAATLLVAACSEGRDLSNLDPLVGPGTESADGHGADSDDSAETEIAGEAAEGGLTEQVDSGEVPFDEMDLPEDDPLPPAENPPPGGGGGGGGGGVPPKEPVNSIPLPTGVSGGPGSIDDYCKLFTEYGSVMLALDSVLGSGDQQMINPALEMSIEVFDRGAELAPGSLQEHRDTAQNLRSLSSVMAKYGYDLNRVFDEGSGAELASIESGANLEAVDEQLGATCNLSLF